MFLVRDGPLSGTLSAMKPSKRDAIVLLGVLVAGVAVWLVYLALEPHDLSRPPESPDFLRTIFGWDAPGFSRDQIYIPDRSWIILAGWPLVGVIAGWYRKRLWISIGIATVLPAWIAYLPTAPRDMDGMWGLGIVVTPVEGAVIAALALAAGQIRVRVKGARSAVARSIDVV
jgi:hypothetical protein